MVEQTRHFISALKTYSVLSSSACKAERAFSTLCRLKTYLRSAQTQERLNEQAVLSTHLDLVEALDLIEAVNEFVSRTQDRGNEFGMSS